MNRRNMLKGAVGATAVSLIPVTAVSGEVGNRELAERLARMHHDDAFATFLCSMSLQDGHRFRENTQK